MSAFNTVVVPWTDAKSGVTKKLRIQFKFGDTWQYEYCVGDKLLWGGNDIGPRDAKYVVVDGSLDGEPSEGESDDFEVHIRDNVIEMVVPASGKFDFVSAEENYVLVESK